MADESKELVCRCEEVTKDEILKAIEFGAHTVSDVRKLTRAGMGLCQGRTCGHLLRKILAAQLGKSEHDLPPAVVRPPVRPLPIAAADTGNDERSKDQGPLSGRKLWTGEGEAIGKVRLEDENPLSNLDVWEKG